MSETATIKKWVGHKLDAAIDLRLQRLAVADDVTEVCVMPDVHLAGDVCNGVVVATNQLIFPQCIGGDIGCGYLSVSLGASEICVNVAARILSGLQRAVPINKHSDREHPKFKTELSSPALQKALAREGRLQLGTLGRGNHFVELQRNHEGELSILIHSGSRAMGQLISAHHLNRATIDRASKLKYIDTKTDAGMELLNDLDWARQYAAANRLAMLGAIEREVLTVIGLSVDRDTMIHLDHNHVQRESFAAETFWIHRKGAQGLLPGQTSVIPGSMGTTTYVVEGRGNRDALNSCAHGAGRAMSRTAAATRISTRILRREMSNVWFDHRKISSLIDEAPSAYKNVRKVMKSQKELVRIVDQRQPVLNFKGR